jgi:hypothetical protein
MNLPSTTAGDLPSTTAGRVVLVGLAVAVVVGTAAVALAVGPFAGGSLAVGPFASDAVGSDDVAFERVTESCGPSYQTSGNADGSDDGGVAVADYDGDGWPDLLAVGGDRPVLFENDAGCLERSGALPDGEYPELKSALFFDADGNGREDLLLVPRVGEPVFLANDGESFHRRDAGFNVTLEWGTGAAAADYDGDGDLDVYVTQNGNWREETPRRNASGAATDGYPNVLFENTDDGFERVEDAGVAGSHWSLATSFVDFTGDGRPDIHVANDYGWDALLVNQGDGTFERRRIPDTNRHGMASVVRDVNDDGHLDLFVTNIEFSNPQQVWELNSGLNVYNRGNTLLLNRGNGTFEERATEYGVREGGWGWAAAVEDFDNDGALDVVHATKYHLLRNQDGSFSAVETTPAVWEGRPGGTFERRNGSAVGFVPSNGRGLVTADFDRDGDRDLVVAGTSEGFVRYENVNRDGHWLQVRVEPDDRTAVGSDIRVVTSDDTVHTRVQSSRSNFFSQSSRTMHFGLGPRTVDRLEVVRPDGTELVFENVKTDRRVRVTANGTLTYAGSTG